jgi:3-isopropylmalate/(R)-2-methylmalate dehydratase small subunit
MKKVDKIKSHAAPLPMKDVDTDLIIPAQYLTSISKDGYGQNLFQRLKEADPNFVLTQEKFKKAEILVVDSNFGCGSSREHAVWALCDYGIKAVIAKSFADIFFSNSSKNGLLTVILPEETVDKILNDSAKGNYEISIDLEKQTVTLPDGSQHTFPFDPFRKHCLLNGLDDIEYILSHSDDINRFRAAQQAERPFSTLGV